MGSPLPVDTLVKELVNNSRARKVLFLSCGPGRILSAEFSRVEAFLKCLAKGYAMSDNSKERKTEQKNKATGITLNSIKKPFTE